MNVFTTGMNGQGGGTTSPSTQTTRGFLKASREVPAQTQATRPRQASANNMWTITTTTGKQYSIDNKQFNWIKNRYQQQMADTYGLDDADQLAKRNGQLSASALKTYKNSNVDRKLAELGLPSEKNLEKYLESYNQWHTGDMDQVFGQMNLPKNYWTNVKGWYKSDMQNAYENTAEDQQRKARGLMPSKWESKYTDTEIDDQLRARGLPPISEFNTYANRWNNYTGIENFYANVARNETNLRLAGIKDDDKEYSYTDPDTGVVKSGVTGKQLYTDAFFDELDKVNDDGSFVYGAIRPMFKNSSSKEPTLTGDYVYDRGAAVTAENKNAVDPDDYTSYNAFSYDDYKSKYNDYYERYFANQQTTSGQTVSERLAVQAREEDAEATRSFYDPKEGEELAFIQQWRKENPKGTAEDMFADMLSNGASIRTARRVMKTARAPENSESTYGGKNKRDDGWGWSDIGKGFVNAKTGNTPKTREEEAENRKDARYDVEAGNRANATFDASGEKADNKIETVQNLASAYDAAYKVGDKDALYSITQKLRALDIASREAADTWLKENADLYSLDNAIEKAKSYMDSNGKWTLENKEAALLQLRRDGFDADTVNAASEHLQLHYGTASNAADDEKAKLSTPEQVSSWMLDYAETHGDTKRGEWTEEKANELFKALDEKGVPASVVMDVIYDEASFAQLAEYADQYYLGKKTAQTVNDQLQEGKKSAEAFIDATLKEQGEDEATIDATKNAIRNPLAAIIDESDSVDVDTVISVLDQVSKMSSTNYTAMKNALFDLGFDYGEFEDWAGDITAGWSDADKQKLRYALFDYMSGIDMKEPETNDKGGYITEKVADTLGDEWVGDHFVQNKVLDSEKFEAAVEWAQEQIASGERTEWEAYQVLAAMGYQNEMQTYMGDDWHRAHYIENVLPGLWAQAEEKERLLYEAMTPEERRNKDIEIWNALPADKKAAIYDSPYWWEADPSVYRTFGQAFQQQMKMVLPGLATEIVSTPVKILDAVTANISGRPEVWDSTQWLMGLQEGIAQYGSVTDNVNGAGIASAVADVAQELGRMYWYGGIGGAIGAGFAGTKAGAAVLAGSASNSAVVRGASKMFMSMVKSSPFVASAFANNYSEAKDHGASNSEATWFGLITGLSEGILEGFEFDELWGKALGQKNFAELLTTGKHTYLERLGIIGKSWVSSMAVSGLGEFTEESIGYVLETFLKMRHSDTWGKGTDWNASDWLQQAMMGFITGALGGGIAAGGSFVSDGVKLANAMKNNPQLQAALPDILTGQGIANSLPEAAMATYRDGGAEVMSKENYGNIIDQIADDYTAIFNAANLLDKTKAEAKAEYDTKVNEINATVSSAVAANVNDSGKLSEFVNKCKKLGISIDFDSIWNTDPQTWAAQIQERVQAAKQNALDNARAEYETALSKAEADFEGNIKQKQRLIENNRKKIQEHYVGLYLQNEDLINSLSDEMLDNLAQAYQNGAKYEPESKAQAEAESPNARAAEAVAGENPADPDNIPWFSKKSKLKAQGAEARPFTDEDAQKVVDVAKALKYKGGITFVDEPDANWQGSITKRNGNIVINKAKLSANDIQKLQSNPAMWVLEHELVHYMGEQGTAAYKKFHNAVVSMLKNSPYIKGNESTYNAVIDGMIQNRAEQGLGTLTREQAEEELVANFAMEYLFDSEDAIKSLFQTNGSVGQQILSWLRYKINQAKLRRSKESWARDILDIERMYAKAYRETRGKTQSTESTDNKAYSAASTRPSYDYSKSLEEIYQDYKDHKMPTDSSVVVGGVGGALRKIGLSRLPVFMNPTHVRYVTNDNAYAASHPNTTEDNRLNHAFTKEEFAKLRSELEDPIAVIAYPNDRDKTINVLTSMRSKNGRLAVVALHLDSNADINGVQNVEGYDVKTIHGRDNYWSLLRNALESDSESNPQVFYLNFDKMKSELSKENSEIKNEVLALSKAKEKASATGGDGQYSSDPPAVGAFIRSIPDAGYRVNTKSQLETKQFQNWFNGSRAKNEDGTPIEFWRTSDGTYTTDRNAADGDETYYLSVKQPYKGDLYITRIKYGSLKDAAIDLSRKGYDSFLTEDANGDAAYIVFRKGQAKLADDANIGLFDKTIKNAAYSGEGESLDWLGEESQDEEDPYADWEPTDDDVYDPWGALAADVYGPQGGFSRERVHAPKDTGVSEKFRPRDDDDVGKKLTRTGDEYSRRNWTPRPPSYMVVDGEFVGRDNLDTGVTAADDEAYMQAAMNGDYLKALEMKDAVARRINAMTIAHGEERGYAYDSINYGRDFGGNPNYFGSTDINTAQTYADNPDVGRHVRMFRVAPNEFDLIEEQLQIDRMFLDKDINLGLDLSYVLEDNLVEPGDPVLMFADSELTPEQASELEEYPMRPVYRVYDKDTGEVLARTYPVSRGRGTTTDAIKMLNDLADKLGIPRGRLLESSPLTGGVQMDYAMPGDQNTYEGSSAFWDEVPTAHDENAQPVDVQFLEEDGGTHMYVVDQETGEVLHDKKFDGYGPEALTHLKQLDVQRAFDEWYGPGEDLWKFATYNAKPLDASSDDMYTRGMMVYNLYDSDESMPAFVENVPDWNRATTDEIGRADYGEGFDATLIKNISDASDSFGRNTITDVYMGHNPNLIKSASPIELKRNGEIIPLSEMFNDARNDKRYSASGESVEDLLRKYGAIEQGREPRARDVEVPKQTNDNNRVSQWIRSLIESGKLTDDQAQNVLRMVVEQDYGTYVPTSQAERMEEARAYIAERQPLQAQQEFHDMVMQGKFGVKTNALGIQLLSDASERGDIASVLDIASDLQLAATEAGQSAQIFNVLKELKGVGSAWYMQKVIDRMNAKYADRIKAGKMNRIAVDPALMAELAKATTVDQMAAAEEAVAKDIARQLPLTWDDRLSSWRYFSMLANPTTHIRNITGNLLMKGLNTAKDVTAIGVQRVAEKLGLASESDRAHAWLTSADKSTWGNWVQRSYEEQARNLSGGSKLGFESFVKQNMRSFDTKWLNALAQFNFKALENEDIAFIKPAYKNALMQYMVAQGYTLNEKGQAGKVDAKGQFREMTKAQMNEAIDWASQQAWKQTFRDASSLATMLNKLSKENAVSRLLVEGVMPFKKTPINIARRGVDYSPAGIIKGIAQLTNGVNKGKVTTAQAIDTLASGITGSALMALGVMLAKLGVIRAGGEKDKKLETFLEDTGDQTYAVKFGDKSINMSSIAPATIPLFMGVALNEMIEQGGDSLDLSTVTDTIAGTLNPFMEMSFMSSLNSALKNYNANGIGGALGSTLMTAAQNYGSQYLPTLGGKIAQFLDPTRRTTKSDITSLVGSNLDYYARSLAKKVPGLESTLQPDVDVWGRTDTKDSFGDWALDFANKFILPTNVKVTNRDAVDNELIRVVESTGVTDFLPSDGAKYFTVNKVKYEMNAKQYSQYSQDRGQAAYAALKDVMAGASYQRASDEEKAAMLKKALDAAYKQVSNQWKERLGAYNK